MFYLLVQNCIGGNCNFFIKMRFIIEFEKIFSRNVHMNKYEIENILQTKPKKSAREVFFAKIQGRQKFQVTCLAGQVVSNVMSSPVFKIVSGENVRQFTSSDC